MRMELIIWELPSLPNTLLGARWYVRSTHAKKWKKLIANALMLPAHTSHGYKQELPCGPAVVTLTRHSPRQGDFDGLVGSFKPVLDALVHLGVLVDDSPEFIKSTYVWTKTPKKDQCISVVIEG